MVELSGYDTAVIFVHLLSAVLSFFFFIKKLYDEPITLYTKLRPTCQVASLKSFLYDE